MWEEYIPIIRDIVAEPDPQPESKLPIVIAVIAVIVVILILYFRRKKQTSDVMMKALCLTGIDRGNSRPFSVWLLEGYDAGEGGDSL